MTTHDTHANTNQPEQPAAAPVYVGVDVSKGKLDLARSDAPGNAAVSAFANDPAGIAALVASLAGAAVSVIVVEATGGYERPLVDALLDASLPAALVNPARARHFAKGLGRLAKADHLDAPVLMEFGRLASPRLAERRSKNRTELEALVTCRRQLLHVRTEQSNRRSVTSSKPALKAIDAVLKEVGKQIDSLDAQIRKLIESDDDFGHLDKLLRSVPGVGPVLAATLIAEMAEIGTLGRREISALAGLAPFDCDSGKFNGKRSIRGGRASVRSVLYMAAVSAMQSNPVIRPFAQRLRAAGKAAKVVIVAAMRKLLTILNAMAREGLTWEQLDLVKYA